MVESCIFGAMGARASASKVNGIPADLTGFVGRRDEVAEIRRLLSVSRLVTLTGIGGVGKTRLAMCVASKVVRAFPDGVWVAELASLQDPGLLAQSVADALGLHDQSGRDPIEAVIDHVQHRCLLLVLDNCEHLVDACAQMVDVLRAAPDFQILATSRHVLGVLGEHVFVVPPLEVPPTDRPLPLRELLQYQAVVLFEQRAAAVLPGFTVTEDNAQTVGRLVHRLDGLPLGVELTAAWLRTLTLSQILNRLEDRFALLTAGNSAALPRQQTLQTLMDWSYGLCSEQERTLWARGSVFWGGFDLQAAEAVCSGASLPEQAVVNLVHGLVEKSILIRQQHGDHVRYQLLETVREYGQNRLVESGELLTMRRRHRDYYLDLTARAQAQWFGPEQVEWFIRLHLDHMNLRAGLDFCLTELGEVKAGMTLAVRPRDYWITVGSLSEGRHWLARLLAADSEESTVRTGALGTYAFLGIMHGALEEALPVLAEYHDAAQRLHDAPALAWAEHHLALAALFQGELPRAAALFEEAVVLHRDLGDQGAVAECMYKLAVVVCLLGDLDRALALCQECEAISAVHEESWVRSDTLFVEGFVRWQGGDRFAADALARQAIRLMRPFNDRWGIAMCVELAAWSAAADGETRRAAHLLGILRSLWETIGGALSVAPFMLEPHRRCEEEVRAALGTKAFDQAIRRGAKLTFDEALACVLEEGQPPAEPSTGIDEHQGISLTRREREVADLVAAGMSNKKIAATLVIAQRTAENHVEHVLAKLGFTSRAQIAVWVSRAQGAGPPPP